MVKLKELHRQRIEIFPTFRMLTIKHSKNELNSSEKVQLNNISNEINRINEQIYLEEQIVIKIKFGEETLNEWNLLKALESEPFITQSEKGQKIISLKTKLQVVQELIETAK